MYGPIEIIPLLLLLMVAGRPAILPQKAERYDVGGALMLAGFGLGKIMLLAFPVYEVHRLCVQASLEAQTGWSAFIAMLSFTLLPFLGLAGLSDLIGCLMKLFKREIPPLVRDPFWTVGPTDFWCRWSGVDSLAERSWKFAFKGCATVALVMWQGLTEGMVCWVVIHGLMILMNCLLGERLRWVKSVPRWMKGILTVLVFMLSMPLIYTGSFAGALHEWSQIFNPPKEDVYSLFLDRRLTTSRTCWLLWAAVLTVAALPGYSWWLAQGRRLRLLTRGSGSLLLIMIVTYVIASRLPGLGQRMSQEVSLWLNADGYHGVSIGDDGWLFRTQELDRLTQRRDVPGLTDEVIRLKNSLKEGDVHLMLLTVPDKLMLYPEPILPAKYWAPVLPPGYHSALERLRSAGVDVLDFTDKLWDERRRQPLYFKQDSHWRAEAMKELAVQVSRHIRKTYPKAVNDQTPLVDAEFIERQDLGDLASALTSSEPENHWSAESTQMVGLRGLHGSIKSSVLVIGGDLVNVFDDPNLSFGPGAPTDAPASFPIQLGSLLGHGLDVIDESQTSELTSRSVGKKLVVWVVRAGDL